MVGNPTAMAAADSATRKPKGNGSPRRRGIRTSPSPTSLSTSSKPGLNGFPDGFVKEIIVNTPEGLSVNPEALPQCTLAQLDSKAARKRHFVGVNYFTVALEGPPACATYPPAGTCLNGPRSGAGLQPGAVYGVPSMVGFLTESGITLIVGSLDPVDQHVIFTISDIESPLEGRAAGHRLPPRLQR